MKLSLNNTNNLLHGFVEYVANLCNSYIIDTVLMSDSSVTMS